MGEKRAYKPRKPGGGRKKLKPEYDAGKNLKEQMESAVALYEEDCSLQSIADALALNPIKVRKLLITAGVYESEVAEKVQDTFEEYRETQDYKTSILSTANTLDLSKAYLLYYSDSLPIELSEIGQWWGIDPKKKKQIQIDIVGTSVEGKDYIIGSCKYRNEKIGVDELDLIRAYASVFGKGNNYHYYIFSKGGFTDGLLQAQERGEVRLITLEDLYK